MKLVNEISIDKMSPGERGRVLRLTHIGDMRRRMSEIGFSRGAELECVGVSPLGDPRAYLVKGAVFAVRQSDAKGVLVIPFASDQPNTSSTDQRV